MLPLTDPRKGKMIHDEPLPLEGLPNPAATYDWASIPLPGKRPPSEPNVTILEHDAPYPTAPGKVSGIVHTDEHSTTVQCATCLRTATGRTPWWVIVANRWNHAPTEGESRQPTPYKRCPECRKAGRHPEEREQ